MATRQERLEQAHRQLEASVEALANGNQWLGFLDQMSRMHRYSVNNQMLIHLQNPDATMVAGVKRWNQMGRHVRKGEKGIAILAPCRYRVAADDQEVTAPDQNDPNWVVRGFRVAYVFDVSQTDGARLVEPPLPKLLEGGVPEGVWDALAEYAAADGWSVEVEPTLGDDGNGPNGFTNFATKRIVVGEHCAPRQAVKTLAHEIGHKMLHGAAPPEERHRGTQEVEAESVAYVVMNGLGIDSSEYTDAYVLHWSAGDVDLVRRTAENVRRVAGEILDAAYERVPELDRAKAIESEAVERHAAHELAAAR